MLPSEIIILMTIVVDGKAGKKLLTHLLDISSEYIGYFYNSLVNRGYLKRHGSDSYQLAPAGREAILDFLKKTQTMSKDIVKRLRSLGMELNPKQVQKIEKMEQEAARVN